MKILAVIFLLCALALATAAADGYRGAVPMDQVYQSPSAGLELNFTHRPFYGGQKLNVYSGPGREYYRGSNGYAKANTDGEVHAAGKENGWALVMYETSGGSVRVGYVDMDEFKYDTKILKLKELNFAYRSAVISSDCILTDDPALNNRDLGYLYAGTEVTYLASYYKHRSWAYIETWLEGRPIRAFVPMNCLNVQ